MNRDENDQGRHVSITKKQRNTQNVSGGFVRKGRPYGYVLRKPR
jgi:hypothetical protein